jgi:beta-lactamase superfamily II metal-dependent hydrolase
MIRLRFVAFALGLAAAITFTSSVHAQAARGLDIYFIDVNGGAATLIITPERESILIDSGWPGFDDRDPKRIVHVLKDLAKLEKLDHLITTHWHVDHYGGVEGISKLVPIGQFWDRGLPGIDGPAEDYPDGPKPDDKLGIAYKKASEGKRKQLLASSALPFKGSFKGLVVASGTEVRKMPKRGKPNPFNAEAVAKPEDPSDNARSLSIKFSLGDFDFLDCGDLTWNIEKDLVCPYDRIGPIDLYQVTHHGMDTSNNPVLVKTIKPTVAIMNNGPRKGGSPATVKLLKSIDSIKAAYQLHKNAATGPDDNTDPALIANKTPEGGQFIHVSVTADGKSFSVQIGEDGEKKTFESK